MKLNLIRDELDKTLNPEIIEPVLEYINGNLTGSYGHNIFIVRLGAQVWNELWILIENQLKHEFPA